MVLIEIDYVKNLIITTQISFLKYSQNNYKCFKGDFLWIVIVVKCVKVQMIS